MYFEVEAFVPLLTGQMVGRLDADEGGDVARKTVLQMWTEANERIELVSADDLAEEIASSEILLLDVRLPIEIERRGTIAGSVPVPRGVLEWWADPDSPYFRPDGVFDDFDQRVVTFCDGGGNGAFTAVALQELGYRNVATLEGGFYGWMSAGLSTVSDSERPSTRT